MNGKVDKAILNMGGWGDKKVTTVGGFKGHEVSFPYGGLRIIITDPLTQVFRYVKGTATKD